MSRCRIAAHFVIVAVLLAASGASAQLDELKNTTPAQRAKLQTEMMKSRLGLTDAELPKVAALNQKYAERMEPVIKGASGPLVKMRQAKEIEQQKEAELKQVLSASQFEKFLASKEEMREELTKRLKEQRAHGR